MYKVLLVSLTFFISAISCNQSDDSDLIVVNSNSLKQMIIKAVNGDTVTNNSLSGLVNLNLPLNKSYNRLSIDSIKSPAGLYFYWILMEYPNPVYNCFAVFDTQLKALIIDRSLNGYLDISTFKINNRNFVKVTETFLSKDIFELNRLSLYSIDSSNVDLAFRSYSRLKTIDNEFTQNITELNDDRIKTEINSSKTSLMSGKGDIFLFDNDFKKYVSSSDIFSGFVRNEVKMFSYPYTNSLVSDYESALHSTVMNDTLLKSIEADVKNFKLVLTEGWTEDSTWTITRNVKSSVFGSTYLNKTAGASISVAPLSSKDSSENYSSLQLKNLLGGNYSVRYSDKKDNGTTYLQYYEFSYCGKKFLVIFEASKLNYEKNKAMYEKILNSFTIDC